MSAVAGPNPTRAPLYPAIYGAGVPVQVVIPPLESPGVQSPAAEPALTQSQPRPAPVTGALSPTGISPARVPAPLPVSPPPVEERKKKKGFFRRIFGAKRSSGEQAGPPSPPAVHEEATEELPLWPVEPEEPAHEHAPRPSLSQTFISRLGSEQLIIRLSDISYDPVRDKLGEGAFADVYKAKYHGAPVAIKVIKQITGLGPSEQEIANFKTEVSVLRQCRHPNVVQLLGVCLEQETFAVVMEYLSGGSVWAAINEGGAIASASLPQRLEMVREAAAGLSYLHSHGVMHRDVKSLNLLLTGDGHVKVADFGISRIRAAGGLDRATIQQMSQVQTNFPGCSPLWAAPEVMNLGEDNMNTDEWKKADMYSFAIVGAEILTGQKPYNGTQFANVAQLAFRVGRQHRPVLPPDLPPRLTTLLQRGWSESPRSRPSFPEFLNELEAIISEVTVGTVRPSAPLASGLAPISEEAASGHHANSGRTVPYSPSQPAVQHTHAVPPQVRPSSVRRNPNQRECVICMERAPDTILLPCRHSVLCYQCAAETWIRDSICPTCRQPFEAAQVGTFTRTFQPVQR